MQINRKLSVKIFILFLAIFLPSCAARDLYNAYQESQQAKEEEKQEQIREQIREKEDEGKSIILEIFKEQTEHYKTYKFFLDNISELNIDSSSLTYYDVQIAQVDYDKVIVTATATWDGLRSFSGITSIEDIEEKYQDFWGGSQVISSQMCRTIYPAKSIQLPEEGERCGSDSERYY